MTNELSHHGILGQKWGIRRYQNADGSLTSAGKKRYGTLTNFKKVQAAKKAASPEVIRAKKARAKAEENTRRELEKYNKKLGIKSEEKEEPKVEKKQEAPKKEPNLEKKKLSEMTDEEINARLNRMALEKRYIEATTPVKDVPKKQQSRGEKFIMDVLETSGKNIASQTAAYLLGTGVNSLLKSIGFEENAIDPKNIQKKK